MGQLLSRQAGNARQNAEGDADYSYPPPSGLYFGNFFTMGGEEFSTMNPEAYLFGDMHDLNLLARIPGSPTVVPTNVQHSTPIRSLVNVHRDSLRLVRHAEQGNLLDEYHLEFFFDADAPCAVTVYLFATETMDKNGASVFASKNRTLTSPTFNYEPGMNVFYSHPDVTISGLARMPREDVFFGDASPAVSGPGVRFPAIVHVQTRSGGAVPSPSVAGNVEAASYAHALTTYATFEQSGTDGPFTVKTLVQKLTVDGMVYVLKEIYGIEKKRGAEHDSQAQQGQDADVAEDDSTECVVCMSEARDTMVLPCRHLCLCNPCAEVLRFQANKCPICRASFHSLLQIRVLQKHEEGVEAPAVTPEDTHDDSVPPGFSAVAVLEALRDGGATSAAPSADTSALSSRQASEAPEPLLPPVASQGHAVIEVMPLHGKGKGKAAEPAVAEDAAEGFGNEFGYVEVLGEDGSSAYDRIEIVEGSSAPYDHVEVAGTAERMGALSVSTGDGAARPLPIRDASSSDEVIAGNPDQLSLPGTPEMTPRTSTATLSAVHVRTLSNSSL